MTDSFYNTIDLEGKELTDAEENALTQEQRVLRWFIGKGRNYSCGPSHVFEAVFDGGVPLTSVRRAMTSLTVRGDLVKSGVLVDGKYGKPEHTWSVAFRWAPGTPHQPRLL